MTRMLRRRPSPAMVVALIALFLSLGGVSYGLATGSIDSREIRNNTIRTRDLRNNDVRGRDIRNSTIGGRDVALNTLTGNDINESKLGTVPKATSADTATTVGGLTAREIRFSGGGTETATILDLGGLVLSAGCTGGATTTVTASTRTSGATLRGYTVDPSDPSGSTNGVNDGTFNQGELVPVVAPPPTAQVAHLVYSAPDGSTVTVDLQAGITSGACLVNGTALQG